MMPRSALSQTKAEVLNIDRCVVNRWFWVAESRIRKALRSVTVLLGGRTYPAILKIGEIIFYIDLFANIKNHKYKNLIYKQPYEMTSFSHTLV